MGLELVDLVAKHVGSVVDTTEHTETTGIGNSSSQLGAGSDVHAGQEDGVVDLEKIGDGSTDLLCCFDIVVSLLDLPQFVALAMRCDVLARDATYEERPF